MQELLYTCTRTISAQKSFLSNHINYPLLGSFCTNMLELTFPTYTYNTYSFFKFSSTRF